MSPTSPRPSSALPPVPALPFGSRLNGARALPYHISRHARAPRIIDMSRYLIGIDLGTTNSALSYIDTRSASRTGPVSIKPFPVPQLVSAGDVRDRPLLPSFLYLPGQHDLPPGAAALPWDPG